MRRWTSFVVVAGLVGALVSVLVPTAAQAADTDLVTFTADPAPSWQTDGIVWAAETVGSVVYVAGTFNNVRPPGAAAGTQQTPRRNFAAFDAATGNLLPCAPSFTLTGGTATVRALEASPDGSRLYAGGSFGTVAGVGVGNVVSLDTATCSVTAQASFRRPLVNATIRALSATPDRLYLVGDFTAVDSQPRSYFASVTAGGDLTPAAVTLNLTARAVVAAPEVGRVIVGGDFTSVNGSTAISKLVALDSETGAVVQSFPGFVPTNSVTKTLIRDDVNFYLAGEGTGGGVFDGRLAANLATGALLWKDDCLGATQALALHQGVLYSGHHAHDCKNTPGGFPEHGQRHHLLAQSAATKHILPWTPNTNGGLGEALGPRWMTVAANTLWVVGEFTQVEGRGQQGIVRFPMSPDVGHVDPPILTATSEVAGKVRLSFTAGWDNDDDAVTYELYDSSTPNTPVWTRTLSSRVWDRPRVNATLDVPAGQTRTYSIRTFEGTNWSPKGSFVTVTSATTTTPYRGDVWLDEPALSWRLDETSGTVAADSSGSARTGTYVNSPTLGQPSALESGAGTSVAFNGSNHRVITTSNYPVVGPSTYSMETWFKTTTNRGGKLIGFGNSRNGNSGSYDRHVYLNNAGNVLFGSYNGATNVLKSPTTYRDNVWHHVVATQGPEGMRLYVDGLQVGSNSITTAQSYTGYWRLGGDNLDSWPERPLSRYFAGSLDETAVYSTALPAARVFQHHLAGRPSAVSDTQPPTTPTNLGASSSGTTVDLTWTASSDNLFLAGYQVHRGTSSDFVPSPATQVGTSPRNSFRDSGVATGTWFYKVVAFDGLGNTSAPSTAVSAVVVDTTPPATPGQPAAQVFGDDVDLTWPETTDNVGVVAYELYRTAGSNDPLEADDRVYSGTARAYTETTVPEGDWHYRVVALDAAGNSSAPSPARGVTTVDDTSAIDFPAVDALAQPTPTFTTTAGSATTIPGATLVGPADPRFTYRGAGGFRFGTTFPDTLMYQPTSRYPYSWGSPPAYSVEFVTNAPVFEVYTKYLNAAQSIQVKIDGQRTTVVPRLVNIPTLGSRLVYKVNLGSSAERRITLEQSFTPFGGIYVPAGSSLTKTPDTGSTRWVVMGDSISGGSNVNTGMANGTWVHKAADYLGWNDTWNASIGGTGYVADNNGTSTSMRSRVQRDVVDQSPDRVVFWAGYNDQTLSQTAIRDAASQTFATVRSGAPRARVYVVGPWAPSGTINPSLASTDQTLREMAAQAGIGFISPSTGKVYGTDGALLISQRQWITGTGYVGNPRGDGNADQYVGTDGIHPSDAGHLYIARRMALALEQLVEIEAPVDVTAPTAPGDVVATSDDLTVSVTWDESTDEVGVTGYQVHRGGTADFTPSSATLVGTVTQTELEEGNVPEGLWFYKVTARDATANVSQPSAPASVQVVADDVEAPSTPAGVQAVANGSDVTLTWPASTDNRGIDGYDIYRSEDPAFVPSESTRIATSVSSPYVDAGLFAGTWHYRLVAVDTSGNRSGASDVASATVSNGAPVEVVLQATADTYVNAGAKSTNYGTSGTLISDSIPEQYGLLRFDLPAAPAGKRLTGAVLTVRTTSSASAGSVHNHEIRFADNGWSETAVTYNDRPVVSGAAPLGTLAAPTAISTNYQIALDAAALRPSVGSTTLAITALGDDSLLLWSTNASTGKPSLRLTYG